MHCSDGTHNTPHGIQCQIDSLLIVQRLRRAWGVGCRQPVEVLVQGSTVRYVSAVGDLKIDASQSYDPDEPSASIAFQWAACYEVCMVLP